MSHPSRRRLLTSVAGLSTLALAASGLAFNASAASAAPEGSGPQCLRAVADGPSNTARQRTFEAAAATYDIPTKVLLGVSYLESRWDDHGTHPSTSGGYGPMHLTDVSVPDRSLAKGDGTAIGTADRAAEQASGLHTIETASDLTGFSVQRLKNDPAANICAGAALLASYQDQVSDVTGQRTSANRWYDAVLKYSLSPSKQDAQTFARHVFEAIAKGHQRVTNDGQRIRLAASPKVSVPATASTATNDPQTDCPPGLGCEWIPAPYEWYGKPDPGAYGNHDIADRPQDLKIDYIVIHDTEEYYQNTLDLVTMATYLGWNYTIRSSDGHVAQHMKPEDVGWHAGNWYVNMHSIGIEHEGFAAQGATWFTEAMYQSSADLVGYLAEEYDIPLDRAHIIGHDQVPAILPPYVQGMHWDPGPYWNWGHYMDLLGAPLSPGHHGTSDVYVVMPKFDRNQEPVTGCGDDPDAPCPPQGTNFVYAHVAPHEDAPLINDPGLHPDRRPSTTYISDWGARIPAGQKVVVADRAPGGWLGVWFAGQLAWVDNSPARLKPSHGTTVTVKPGTESAPVYGRAYPEPSAYDPYQIPVQNVAPLQYDIEAGQKYVLADDDIQTDYYYAKSFNCEYLADDCTDVQGEDEYYEIWYNHRIKYVRAADVQLHR